MTEKLEKFNTSCSNRHTSLIISPTFVDRFSSRSFPRRSVAARELEKENFNERKRINSWGGIQSLFNPHCPIHGHRALIEAYARDKYLKVNFLFTNII